ncbi:class I SAM-dependent methyltransferase [Skermania piniformis]|uniref:Class I SAM-dependent methyltransferase n=1 Tax=Skermania pinensis TaxID=39122 RepID=A0ABX8S7J3_9ACTN|nr:class I SAM-dependent methyltransferase [Skermania piniformis]QXQ12979.1 class I SAM-dependent methyltransferase [Skermania piniformis]
MSSKYDAVVDPDAPNNAHSFAVEMVGWNQRVLELGAASGHVTRVLAARGCDVTAVEHDPSAAADLDGHAAAVVVGDLNDPSLLDQLDDSYDVILAGDVLEHLVDPQSVLDRMVRRLAPNGRIIVSLPNVAHADIRMALAQGRFDYNDWGLLDSTHIRFFTMKTIEQMVRRSGLLITELKRVRMPAFETEIKVDRRTIPTALISEIFKDPEAETYQFVFTAVRDDGIAQTSRLAAKYLAASADHERILISSRVREILSAEPGPVRAVLESSSRVDVDEIGAHIRKAYTMAKRDGVRQTVRAISAKVRRDYVK